MPQNHLVTRKSPHLGQEVSLHQGQLQFVVVFSMHMRRVFLFLLEIRLHLQKIRGIRPQLSRREMSFLDLKKLPLKDTTCSVNVKTDKGYA